MSVANDVANCGPAGRPGLPTLLSAAKSGMYAPMTNDGFLPSSRGVSYDKSLLYRVDGAKTVRCNLRLEDLPMRKLFAAQRMYVCSTYKYQVETKQLHLSGGFFAQAVFDEEKGNRVHLKEQIQNFHSRKEFSKSGQEGQSLRILKSNVNIEFE